MRKTIYTYNAWDGTRFDDLKAGALYDHNAFKKIGNKILFFCYNDYNSFDLIPESELSKMITDMRIYHTNELELFLFYTLEAPIIYCHTDAAAKVINGLINNVNGAYKILGIKKGFMFFTDKDCRYHSEDELIISESAAPDFNKLIDTMNYFIKENM